MSRNALILERAVAQPRSPSVSLAVSKSVPRTGEYSGLVRSLFPDRSVVAVVDVGSATRAPEACRGIAAELAATGNRVVIVEVSAVLRTGHVSDVTACEPGPLPNIFHWPSAVNPAVDFFPPPEPEPVAGGWLAALRRNFDAILLDCPSLDAEPGAALIAAMSDASILVVNAGRTTRQQIQLDQQALAIRGVKLAGSILMRKR